VGDPGPPEGPNVDARTDPKEVRALEVDEVLIELGGVCVC